MKVLLIEKTADGLLDIAIRADRLGHQVKYFLQSFDLQKCPAGRGLVPRVGDWREHIGWADLVALGSNDLPMREIATRCRARGVPLIGGNEESAAWENDRLYGMSIMRKAGIAVPPVREFTDYASAIAYVEKAGEPMYSKPCWPDADKALSCKTGVADDPTYMLRKFQREGNRPKGTFILQESVKGIEMGVGSWVGPNGFAPGWEQNFEFKRLCAGDIGQNTGEMGSVLRIVDKCKLADKTLRRVEEMIVRTGFVGSLDVNTIIDEDGEIWPLEWTVRAGWPALNIEQALFTGDFIEFLAGLAEGKPSKDARRMDVIAVGTVLAIPPFPFHVDNYSKVVGVPILGVTPAIEEKMHWAEVAEDRGGLVTAGDYVGVAVGTGESVVKARAVSLRTLERLQIPAAPFWRNDIGGRLRGELPKLQANGLALGLDYA